MISNDRIREWVEAYLAHIKEITLDVHVRNEEGYKFRSVEAFQKHYVIDAPDLVKMLEASIVNNNLVAGSWYFPRKMLLIFAEESPKETRAALHTLLEGEESADTRIDEAEKRFDLLMDDRNKRFKAKAHSFIGVRFLSLLLSYRHPDKYNSLKPREWKFFCRYIDPDFKMPSGITSGKQYDVFTPYIEALRQQIMKMPGVDKVRMRLTDGLDFKDAAFRWMAQDIIFVTSSLIARTYDDAKPEDDDAQEEAAAPEDDIEEKIPATLGRRFYYEEDLENFIIDNFADLEPCRGLVLYKDHNGATGRQYHTDFGDIDILAKDKEGDFVVIELKRDKAKAEIIGQIAKYMQWVEDNLAQKNGHKVSGMIMAHRGDAALENAARALRFPVAIKYYSLDLRTKEPAKAK